MSAAVGAVVTVVSAAIFAMLAFWRQLRQRRESAWLRRFTEEFWVQTALEAGRMRIPDIAVIASCSQGREWTDAVHLEFSRPAEPRPVDPALARLRAERLPHLIEAAKAAGVPFTNGPCVDVRRATVSLSKGEDGRRTRTFRLEPAPAEYFDFAVAAARLDETWTPDSAISLREHWAATPSSLADLENLPCLAKVGVGTAVVTKDNRLVLGVRGKTHVASNYDTADDRALVHIVAEGMIPEDTNNEGLLDPIETARRGLHEELGVSSTSTSIGRVDQLVATGFFFDQKRWQPYFAYLTRLDVTWDELQTLAPAAADYWEVERLISLPFDIHQSGVRRLLTGTHPDLALASNHASAVLWFALLHRHGIFEVRDALSAPIPPPAPGLS